MGVRLDSLFTVTRVACKVSFRLRRCREMGKRFILGVISFIRKMVGHHFFSLILLLDQDSCDGFIFDVSKSVVVETY